MIRKHILICPRCKGKLRYYDTVKRMIKTKGGQSSLIYISRYKCSICGSTHRELPDTILPFKHYEKELIYGVLNCYITSETLGYEDYPCEKTMIRWKEQYKKH